MAKLTDTQRAAFNARDKQEFLDVFFKAVGPAAQSVVQHVRENPDCAPAHYLREPFIAALFISVGQKLVRLRDELAQEAEESERKAAAGK